MPIRERAPDRQTDRQTDTQPVTLRGAREMCGSGVSLGWSAVEQQLFGSCPDSSAFCVIFSTHNEATHND